MGDLGMDVHKVANGLDDFAAKEISGNKNDVFFKSRELGMFEIITSLMSPRSLSDQIMHPKVTCCRGQAYGGWDEQISFLNFSSLAESLSRLFTLWVIFNQHE